MLLNIVKQAFCCAVEMLQWQNETFSQVENSTCSRLLNQILKTVH